MFSRMTLALTLTLALLAASVQVTHAGPQYIDETGYAASGYDVVAYHELEQAPVGEPQPDPVPGKTSITAEYNGATWAFANEENKRKFLADPETYAPRFDGHCALGVAKGSKVPGNPNLWRIVDGDLYLNITPGAADIWQGDIPGNITVANDNWSSLESGDSPSQSWKALPSNKETISGEAPLQK